MNLRDHGLAFWVSEWMDREIIDMGCVCVCVNLCRLAQVCVDHLLPLLVASIT